MANVTTKYPAIPAPTKDPAALLRTVESLKEAVELLTGNRSPKIKGLDQTVFEISAQTERAFARIREVNEVVVTGDAALAQRTTTLEAQYEEQDARITQVDTARADGDEALARSFEQLEADYDGITSRVTTIEQAQSSLEGSVASSITELQADYNDISANGSIRFIATATPTGAEAAFALALTAGTGHSGLTLIAKSDGTSSLAVTVGQFAFLDPVSGAPKQVFTYNAGKFVLTGDVTINGQLIVNGTVDTDQIAPNAVTTAGGVFSEQGTPAVVPVTIKSANSPIIAIIAYDGAEQRYFFGTVNPGSILLHVDGNPDPVVDKLVSFTVEGNSDNRAVAVMATTVVRIFKLSDFGLSAGTRTFTASIDGSMVGGLSLVVLELTR